MVSRFLLLGLALAAGLGWLALEWLREPPAPQPPPLQDAREPTPLNLPSAYAGDIDAFLEIVERPLFIEGRQPPSVTAANDAEGAEELNQAPATQQSLGNFRLTAIIDESGKRSALLEGSAGETERIDVGSRVSNWTVDSIGEDSVVLRAGATKTTLEIYRFETVPVRSTPRRRPRLLRNRADRADRANRGVADDMQEIEDLEEEIEDYDRDGPEDD